MDIFDDPLNLVFFEEQDGALRVSGHFSGLFGPESVDRCDSCGGTRFSRAQLGADLVCDICGLILGGKFLPGSSGGFVPSKEPFECPPVQARVVCCPSFSYAGKQISGRQVYFRERVKQWFLSESPIFAADWAVIEQSFVAFCLERKREPKIPDGAELRGCGGRRIEGCVLLEKEDVRSLLRACESVKENNFVTKFLEKWLTIRWRFSGQQSTAKDAPDQLVDMLISDFDKLDAAFISLTKTDPKRSFPCYNSVISKLLQLYNLNHLAADFPALATPRARKKFEVWWWKLCQKLKWPYISKDARFVERWLHKKILK